ncbi:MAG: hypothetical protein IT374_12050 [Polyangiaceae bacterium]|nr:hypothetical protein [Polyangiaceae bacterium]
MLRPTLLSLSFVLPLAACGGSVVDQLPAGGAGGASGSGSGVAGNGGASVAGNGGASVAGSGGASVAGSGGAPVAGSGGAPVAGHGGGGVAGSAGGTPWQCTSSAQCPVGPCQHCPDGSLACPSAQCVQGTCTTSQPTCSVGPMCKTASDCPQLDAPCQQCPDGSVSCPTVDCVGGVCVFDAGGGCPAVSCAAQDAKGDGLCFGLLGVRWTGDACENVTGCQCLGADCGALYASVDKCEKAHVQCSTGGPCAGKTCGDTCSNCPPGSTCPPVIEYCSASGSCGPAFPVCSGPSGSCTGAQCGASCTYMCDAPGCMPKPGTCNAAGDCTLGDPVCSGAKCDAMKAEGQGPCALFFGYAWNGQQCVGLGGCSCQGPDCNKLYKSMDACVDARAACACQGKACGAPCDCLGKDCAPTPYTCTSDFNGSCQPGLFACPF